MNHPPFENEMLCTQTDPELFFPRRNTDDGRYAKMLCNKCESKVTCLNYALQYHVFGIWGGTTYQERAKIRRERKIKALEIVDVA
jgi:WhiB family redox-sensing transcriptional regulator